MSTIYSWTQYTGQFLFKSSATHHPTGHQPRGNHDAANPSVDAMVERGLAATGEPAFSRSRPRLNFFNHRIIHLPEAKIHPHPPWVSLASSPPGSKVVGLLRCRPRGLLSIQIAPLACFQFRSPFFHPSLHPSAGVHDPSPPLIGAYGLQPPWEVTKESTSITH